MPSIETSWPLAEPVAAQTARPVPIVARPLAIRRHFLAALGVSMVLLALLLIASDAARRDPDREGARGGLFS